MAGIKQVEKQCPVCNKDVMIFVYKDKELTLFYGPDRLMLDKPICSRACLDMYSLTPMAYDGSIKRT